VAVALVCLAPIASRPLLLGPYPAGPLLLGEVAERRLRAAPRSWAEVGSKRTGPANQRDYMACTHVLLVAAGLVAGRHQAEQGRQEPRQGGQGDDAMHA
jgi:hypothetical protein